jgi:hypothetical protein
VKLSNIHFDKARPYWRDYLPRLAQLIGESFPTPQQLNTLLPDGLISGGGKPIRFITSSDLVDDHYERRIYTTGQVSTRPDSWHDLFNALVWIRFPRIKSALNSLHHKQFSEVNTGSRGAQRDALTLFDESGVIVFSAQEKPLDALAQRNWRQAFGIQNQVQHIICGHAILEKYISPYKSMTAKALLVKIDPNTINQPREELLTFIDRKLADLLLSGELLRTPACLSPLPLAGIPGWWDKAEQDIDFYSDQQVFRPPASHLTPAPVIRL